MPSLRFLYLGVGCAEHSYTTSGGTKVKQFSLKRGRKGFQAMLLIIISSRGLVSASRKSTRTGELDRVEFIRYKARVVACFSMRIVHTKTAVLCLGVFRALLCWFRYTLYKKHD